MEATFCRDYFAAMKVISIKDGRREKTLVDEAFSSDNEDVIDSVNKTVYESIEALPGDDNYVFLKGRISSIAGGSSTIHINVDSPNFGDFLFIARCYNGEDFVESQRGFAHETFKDYEEFNEVIINASRLVLSEMAEKMSEEMYDSLKLDKGFEVEVFLSKSKEDFDSNCIFTFARFEFDEEEEC